MASGNGISGLLNFKIFWGTIPQTPLETGVTGAPLACRPAQKFLATAMHGSIPQAAPEFSCLTLVSWTTATVAPVCVIGTGITDHIRRS